ncbi:MAG: hypothetical protein ABSC36_02930 [Gaiellaceae bacterium]|jgi:hypothetical protein
MTGEIHKRNIQRKQAAASLLAVVSSSRPGLQRERPLFTEAADSEALERVLAFARRTLLLSFVCALLLACSSTFAGAASSATPSTKFSANLTLTSFVASQTPSVKLIYKFPRPTKSFTYRLSLKKGSAWLLVKSATKKGNFKAQATISVSKLFAGKLIKVGYYRLQISSAGTSKLLSFQIVPFAGYLTKKSFTVAQAKSIKLTYAFSKPSKSFAYKLALKQGSTLQVLHSAKTVKKTKSLYLTGIRTASLKSLFGGTAIVLGSYRLTISSAYSTRRLNFQVVKSAGPAISAGGSTGSGSGNGSASTAGADFTITGGVSGLEPGLTLPIALTLANPNSVQIYVTKLTVSVSSNSTRSGCDSSNLQLTQSDASSTNSIAVPAKGKVTLTSAPRAPQITFIDLPTVNQDACKNASFTLAYSGSAHS